MTQREKMEPGPILLLVASWLLVACSVNSPVPTIGFVRPNLLRFSRGVWCAWGLRPLFSHRSIVVDEGNTTPLMMNKHETI